MGVGGPFVTRGVGQVDLGLGPLQEIIPLGNVHEDTPACDDRRADNHLESRSVPVWRDMA